MTSKQALNILNGINIKLRRIHKIGARDVVNNIVIEYADGINACVSQLEKDLKVLEIIKLREIDTKDITETTDDYDLYVAYCEGKGYSKEYICDKKEFELLKQTLKTGK